MLIFWLLFLFCLFVKIDVGFFVGEWEKGFWYYGSF